MRRLDAKLHRRGCRRRTLCASAVLLLFASCATAESDPVDTWRVTFDPPAEMADIVAAVSAMPECDAVRRGGVIHWRTDPMMCNDVRAAGCAYPFEDPPIVEVIYNPSAGSTALAHELCHVCGYLKEEEAEGCAARARLAVQRLASKR